MEASIVRAEHADAAPLRAPIRVLHLITSLARGGAENHLLALLAHGNRDDFEFETAVIAGEGDLVPVFRSLGIAVHTLRARGKFDPLALRRLVEVLRNGNFDILHSHLFRADIYAGLALAQLGKHRPMFVSTRHNDDRFFLNPFVGIAHYVLSTQQDMIIAISDHIARFTVARGVRHPSRVRRVYHGLETFDTLELQRDALALRAELGVAPDDFLIGNVGRLVPQKGQRHLVLAMPLLLERVPRARALIVGAGALDAYLRGLIDDMGLTERVHVLGARRDVPTVMHALDAFVMPSIWEGFGLVLLEAMAAGRPIVASRAATIPEVVLDGETGLLVPPGDPPALADALAQLAEDPALAHGMGEAGRLRLHERFSVTKMVGDTEGLYRELLGLEP